MRAPREAEAKGHGGCFGRTPRLVAAFNPNDSTMLRSTACIASLLTLFVAAGCAHQATATNRDGSRLSLREPNNQTIRQGESNRVAVHIDRDGFGDPVKVQFTGLPRGISVQEDTIPAGDSARDFVLVASTDAALVERQIVTVHAAGNGMNTTQTFELTVKPHA